MFTEFYNSNNTCSSTINIAKSNTTKLPTNPVSVSSPFMLGGGYSVLYENRLPIDLKDVDYDRNVNHLGKAEFVIIRIFTYVLLC